MNKKELTVKEELVKDFLENMIVPALRNILEKADPLKFKEWGGNCCRQTAYVTASVLNSVLPQYKWTVWEGKFNDRLNNAEVTYEHAWVFGIDSEDDRKLFIDMGRIHTSTIFMLTDNNRYPKDDVEYKNLKEISRIQLNFEELRNSNEYYTKIKGYELVRKVKKDVDKKIGKMKRLED